MTRRLPQYREVIDLYRRAFPREEQLPIWHMRLMTLRRGVRFRAWFDDGALVGLTYTVDTPFSVWLFYLAVNDAVRSRGYGSRILSGVRRHAAGRTVVLEVEPLDDDAPNIEQRRRRRSFYERTGFTPTGYHIREGKQTYSVMTDGDVDPIAFRRLVHWFTLGLRPTVLMRD